MSGEATMGSPSSSTLSTSTRRPPGKPWPWNLCILLFRIKFRLSFHCFCKHIKVLSLWNSLDSYLLPRFHSDELEATDGFATVVPRHELMNVRAVTQLEKDTILVCYDSKSSIFCDGKKRQILNNFLSFALSWLFYYCRAISEDQVSYLKSLIQSVSPI